MTITGNSLTIMCGKFVCLTGCHALLALSVLHGIGRGPRSWRLSCWALGTCAPT